jgi:peptide deformylase
MTLRHILKMGDPRLLRTAQPVPPDQIGSAWFTQLLQDLQDTMRQADGAGLAAPQIGEDWQVVIFGSDQINPRYPDAPVVPRTVLVNPVLTPLSDAQEDGWEGCLSVPGLRAVVPRWAHIRYQGLDEHGQAIDRQASGFHARVVQHECDHVWGTLYPMRVRDFSRFGFTEVLFPHLADGTEP